jgi:glutathione S-transferase
MVREITVASWRGIVTAPDQPMSRRFEALGGLLASGLRMAAGTVARPGPRAALPMRLWDFERCPHSRSVREALSMLDLDAEVRPCPKGGTRFRPELAGGRVPRLEDPNAGVTLHGSVAIVDHLCARYGTRRAPWLINRRPLRMATGLAFLLLTRRRGAIARPSRAPDKPLELWSFESSTFSRFVRFTLSELELPYLLHNLAKGSPRRPAFVEMSGKMQLPFLHDPNTGVKMFESLAIERYLESTYASAPREPAKPKP